MQLRTRIGVLAATVLLAVTVIAPGASAVAPTTQVGSHLVDMEIGSEGEHVAALQASLRALKMYRGEIDGKYGWETAVSVMALKKWLGVDRSWEFGAWDWWHLTDLPDHGIPDRPDEPDRIEVDLGRQLLFLVLDGEVAQIVHTSTGGGYTYWSERNQRYARGTTPRGDFTLRWFRNGWQTDSTTGWTVYDYWAFTDFYGIHGYPSVPSYAASHGCVRVNTWEADALQEHFYVGMPIHIWDVAPDIEPPPAPALPVAFS